MIDQLRKERDGFIEKLVEGSRRIGQLESELRQLSAPRNSLGGSVLHSSESDGNAVAEPVID